MQGAVGRGLGGILAECGGNVMGATCHVYVDPDHLERLAPMNADEDALLYGAASERRTIRRLRWQPVVWAVLDGFVSTFIWLVTRLLGRRSLAAPARSASSSA